MPLNSSTQLCVQGYCVQVNISGGQPALSQGTIHAYQFPNLIISYSFTLYHLHCAKALNYAHLHVNTEEHILHLTKADKIWALQHCDCQLV